MFEIHSITSKFLTPGIGFPVTLAFGFCMSRNGKPYNGILFNVHKRIALGLLIYFLTGRTS